MPIERRQTGLLSVPLPLRAAIQGRFLCLLLRQLDIRVVVALVHVDVTALVADRAISREEKLASVVERSTTRGHLVVHFIVFKESAYRYACISNLVLDVGEALVTT